MADGFAGFPRETFSFYRDISENNNKQWFDAHKERYQSYVLEPAQAFIEALGEKLTGLSRDIAYDTRTNGSGSFVRIYRDVRFSKDKTPYKTWMGIVFWTTPGKRMQTPAYYFGLDATGARFYCGWHGFDKAALQAYREAVDGTAGAKLQKVLAGIRGKKGFELEEPQYKRVPRGYDPEHPRAELLRYNSMGASSPSITVARAGKPDLVDLCLDYASTMKPLFLWLRDLYRAVNTAQ